MLDLFGSCLPLQGCCMIKMDVFNIHFDPESETSGMLLALSVTEEVNTKCQTSCFSACTPHSSKLCAQLVRGHRPYYSRQRSSPGRSWGSAWCPSLPALLTHTPKGWRWSWRCSASWWEWWQPCMGSLWEQTRRQQEKKNKTWTMSEHSLCNWVSLIMKSQIVSKHTATERKRKQIRLNHHLWVQFVHTGLCACLHLQCVFIYLNKELSWFVCTHWAE